MRVLIVDDDELDRQIIKRALHLGYHIREVATAKAALTCFDNDQFDLVMIDCHMPEQDGIEITIALREAFSHKKAIIVLMSHSENDELAIKALRAGAHDFILKSDISATRLQRVILYAQVRFDLENRLHDSVTAVKRLAEQDPLTGLANRYLLQESLKIAVTNNRRNEHVLMLVVIGVDDLGHVNTRFGRDEGDTLLQNLVKRLHACLRGNEVFARIEGDMFAVQINNLKGEHDAVRIVQRIAASFDDPMTVQQFAVQVSMGVALHTCSTTDSDDLLLQAKTALYRAKKQGKHQVCFFDQALQNYFSEQAESELFLRYALDHDGMCLHYQPIYNTAQHASYDTLSGFEALLHWKANSSTRECIALAEKTGLMRDIGLWSIEQAIAQHVLWQKITRQTLTMSINLSPMQLAHATCAEDIMTLLSDYGAQPSAFVFEVTDIALQDMERRVGATLKKLKGFGCKVALDSFGAKKLSLDYLKTFPIDMVKLDPDFLPKGNVTKKEKLFFTSVVKFVKALDLDLVVVGTENIEQVEACCALPIDKLQGHYFSHPQPAKYVEKYVLGVEE